jgi:hypothetical protein
MPVMLQGPFWIGHLAYRKLTAISGLLLLKTAFCSAALARGADLSKM